MKLFLLNIILWIQDRFFNRFFKRKEKTPPASVPSPPTTPPPVKVELPVEESREQKIKNMNKKQREAGYICCHECGRSSGLFRMTLHKRVVMKGKKKTKVYFCGDCVSGR